MTETTPKRGRGRPRKSDAHNAAMAARYAANKDEINRKKREARAAKKVRGA